MTAAPRRPDGAKLHLLVALPQSGRSRWLAEQAISRSEPGGRLPLWVAGAPGTRPPAGVVALDRHDLVGLDLADLEGRVLAVDDLHALPHDLLHPLAEVVEAALAHGTAVLATSLAVPHGPLARWAEERRVEWHRQEDLAVDEDAFVQALAPLGVPVRHAQRLHLVVDGWAGPLAVAAQVPAGASDIDASSVELSAVDRATRDLAPLVATVEQRTLAIAVLPAISASLIDAIVGRDERDAWLATAQRFLPPALDIEVVLRPHPVLRRILEHHLPDGAEVHEIRERAIAWYLARDWASDAIRVLIEDDRFTEALDTIRAQLVPIALRDGRPMVRRLIDELPRSTWGADERLLYAVACMFEGDHREAGYQLTLPVLHSADLPDALTVARDGCIAYLGLLSHPPDQCIVAARKALATLDQLPPTTTFPPVLIAGTHEQFRCGAHIYLGRSQIVLGEWDDALDTLDQAGRCGHPLLDHAWTMYRAWLHALRGEASEAQRLAAQALDAADFWLESRLVAVEARLSSFEVLLLQGRNDAALEMAHEAIACAERRRSAHQLACALVATAEALLCLGRPAEARDALDRIGDGAYGFVDRRAKALRARALLATGEHDEAAVLLQRLPLDQHTIVAHATGIAAGIGGPIAADDVVGWHPPPWRSAQHVHEAAAAVLARGPRSGAIGPAVARSTGTTTTGRSAAADRLAAAHGLSDREAEVLRALLVDQPLAEVASQLAVSPNTLKTHLRRTYRKLGVSSRQEAVELVASTELDPG